MEINLQNAKIELIQWLTTLEDSSVIEKIVELRNSETKDWWDQISIEEKKSVELGIKDVKDGKVKPHTEAQKVYGKWL